MHKELDLTNSVAGIWEDEPDEPVDLDDMHCAKSTLDKFSLLLKACFVMCKAVYVQFDSGS